MNYQFNNIEEIVTFLQQNGWTVEKQSTIIECTSFSLFWNLYDKKRERKVCENLWKKLKETEKMAIMEHVPKYVASTPDIQFRKDPARYLRNRCWEDQIIQNNNENVDEREQDFFADQAALFAGLNASRKQNP